MRRVVTALLLTATLLLPVTGESAPYQVVAVEQGGSVSGRVTFEGNDPAPTLYKITKDNSVCGTGDRLIDYVKVKEGGLSDVIVYLDKVTHGKPFPAEMGKAVIDQKRCEFLPFLQVMKNDAAMTVSNDDPLLHNVHTYEMMGRRKKTVFNVSQPDAGTVEKSVKLKRGNAMKVECDAHDFMHSFIFVANNPYYAIVTEDGHFSIENIPPGDYTIKAWHGTLPEQQGKVTVGPNGTATINFTFRER